MAGAKSDDELARTATAPGSSSGEVDPAPVLGPTLGRYRLERALGEGGMGVVHAAFDPDLERRVALKVLRGGGGGDEARQRLLREARAMARLTHPNVVTVHEVGTAGGRDYVAMELIEGETLADWMRAAPRTPDEIVAAFAAAGRGLAAAHAAGLVHRDFKPHNVLRRRDGRICVTDFGLARGVETASAIALETTLRVQRDASSENTPSPLSGLTATGSVLGTPAYMAPEQWSGGTVGPAADQFAFCVALWEALTGERPFRGATLDELKREVARGPAALDASALPRRLRAVLRRGLDPDPAKRWQSMNALLDALGSSAAGAPPPRPRLFVAVAGAIVIAAAVALYVLSGRAAPPSCPDPVLDPQAVWSPSRAAALVQAGQGDGASAIAADFAKWFDVRGKACRADPSVREAQLACLDGVLSQLDGAARAFAAVHDAPSADPGALLVDPGVCDVPRPPRLATAISKQRIAVMTRLLETTVSPIPLRPAEADRLVAESASDPCAAVTALTLAAAVRKTTSETRRDLDEADSAAQRCGDDSQILDIAYVRARDAIAHRDADARSKLERAEAAANALAQPDVRAGLDELRAIVAEQSEHVDEAIKLLESARDGYHARGHLRDELRARLSIEKLREIRARPEDLAEVPGHLDAWRAEAEERFGPDDPLTRTFADAQGFWQFVRGDVAAAHARFLALARELPLDQPVPASGRVVDEHGAPVAGALVVASGGFTADSLGIWPDASQRRTTTRADGTWELREAPDHGVVIAQLGARLARPVTVGEHLTLALEPTSRVEGRVDLRGAAPTSVIVFVRDPDLRFRGFVWLAPVHPDGSFTVDGVQRGHMMVHAQLQRAVNPVIAGTPVTITAPVVRGVQLAVPVSRRDLDIVVRSTVGIALTKAEVFVMPGHVEPATVAALLEGLQDVHQGIATPIEGEHAPADVLRVAKPGDVYVRVPGTPEGLATACGLAIPSEIEDPDFRHKLDANMDRIQVRCVPIGEHDSTVVVEVPPWPRLD